MGQVDSLDANDSAVVHEVGERTTLTTNKRTFCWVTFFVICFTGSLCKRAVFLSGDMSGTKIKMWLKWGLKANEDFDKNYNFE